MELKVNIVKDGVHLFAIIDGAVQFQFEPRINNDKKSWFFWGYYSNDPVIIDEEKFPIDYFNELCKARHFVKHKDLHLADTITIISGEKYLKWKK